MFSYELGYHLEVHNLTVETHIALTSGHIDIGSDVESWLKPPLTHILDQYSQLHLAKT